MRGSNDESERLSYDAVETLRILIDPNDLPGATCLSKHSSSSRREAFMQRAIGLLALTLLLTILSGCSYLFYPRAGDYATQAKGASGVETMINLTSMMEATAAKA